MRIFFAFLVVMGSVLLFSLPLTDALYDFKTDVQEDSFTVETGVAETTADVVLSKSLYGDDVQTISLASSISESPLYYSYNGTARTLSVSSLSENTTRSLYVDYDVSALEGAGAIETIADRLPLIWLLMIIALPPAALAAIFLGRA